MSRNAFFGDAVHFLGADLHFKRLAAVEHRGVQRLVEIGPSHGDVVLEAPGNRPPDVMYNAQSGIAIALVVGDDAEGEKIVDLIEAALLAHDFAMKGIKAFDARFELRGNAVFDEFGADSGLHFLQEFFANRSLVADLLLQGKKRIGFEIAEGKVFQLTANDAHAETVGDRRVDVESFAGDALLLGGLEVFQSAHVVQAIGELDEYHANVVHHGQQHFADAFGLTGFRGHDIEASNLGDARDEASDLGAKALLNAGDGELGVFDDVVKQGGGEGGGVESHVGKDVGHFEQMREVGIAGTAELIAMAFSGDLIGAANDPRVFGGAVVAELGEEFVKAGVELALGAVAMEIQGQIAGRRHGPVYDGTGVAREPEWPEPHSAVKKKGRPLGAPGKNQLTCLWTLRW